jgi:membrane dipeptidase
MDQKLQEHVAHLQTQAFSIDAHFDLIYDVANRRERGEREVIKTRYLNDFKRGGFKLIVSAMFIHDLFLPEMGLRRALDQISCLHEEMEETPGLFRLCRSVDEAQAAQAAGEVAIFLSLEGADPLQNDIRLLRIFYELGVRGLGVVWSRRNYAADGAFFEPQREGRKGGLTPFGVSLVAEAEKLGMFIDVSHLNDEGFWDVMEVAQKPLIASHSNCRALAPTMRNLTDDQIHAIAEKGGVIGMNSVNHFTARGDQKAEVAALVNHVDHIATLVGIDHVGIGFDICNSFENFVNFKEKIQTYDIIPDHSQLKLFTAELIRRGYSDDTILAVLGGNFLRVFTTLLD